jgi:ankyrin repeat protein
MQLKNNGLFDEYDELGMTPLLYAVFQGDLAAVKALLIQGADGNKPQRDDSTATPLWHAQEDFGLLEIADLLKLHGAKLA